MNAVTAKLFFRDKSEVIHRYEKRVGHRAAVCGYHLQMVAGLMFWSGIGGVIGLFRFQWGAVDRIEGGLMVVGQVTPPAWSSTLSR